MKNQNVLAHERGFTLIELSIVMILLGIGIVAAIQAYTIYDEKRKFETTELRLTDVEGAINDFVEVNGRLPCAAPRGVDRSNKNYGREVNCKAANAGTARVMGKNSQRVRIGMLPARTLGISDIYMQDAYGNSLVYAVTEGLTDEATYAHDGGGIDVLDNTGTSRLSAVDYAQFILVSPGHAGYGAYSYAGKVALPCDRGRLEGENCDDDAIFMDTDLARGDNKAAFYDDRVVYKHRLNVVLESETPMCEQVTGTFIAGETCPEGWEEDSSIATPTLRTKTYFSGSPTYSQPKEILQGKYYMLDEKTGDYFFVDEYQPSAGERKVNYGEKSLFGYPQKYENQPRPDKQVFCRKENSNKAQTKCFTETFISPTCPAGYAKIGTAGTNLSHRTYQKTVDDAGSNQNSSKFRKIYSSNVATAGVCGKI